jgi:hypothetical protein
LVIFKIKESADIIRRTRKKVKKNKTLANKNAIDWNLPVADKEKEFINEEKEEVYFWAKRIDKNLKDIDENGKIILLYNKWLGAQNGNSDNGNECRNVIEGKTIVTAYEMKDFKLMKKNEKEVDLRNSDQFYKLKRLFSKERKSSKGRDDFRNV